MYVCMLCNVRMYVCVYVGVCVGMQNRVCMECHVRMYVCMYVIYV